MQQTGAVGSRWEEVSFLTKVLEEGIQAPFLAMPASRFARPVAVAGLFAAEPRLSPIMQ
jgi:hypothetical protein